MYANMEIQNKLIDLIKIVDSIYNTSFQTVNQLLPVALLPTVQLNIDY